MPTTISFSDDDSFYDWAWENMQSGAVPTGVTMAGFGGNDTLLGDYFSDNIYGGTGNDDLYGRAGNDFLYGEAGSDWLNGGPGQDVIDGGDGEDVAVYWLANEGVGVDLLYQGLNYGEAAGDQLYSIEIVEGSDYDDHLGGDHNANALFGEDGNDLLAGRGGDDRLYGSWGNDRLIGEEGGDLLDGGTGVDIASYESAKSGVGVDLLLQASNFGDAAGDQLLFIENLAGSKLGDFLAGDSVGNEMFGDEGNDKMAGRGGRDILRGDAGDDQLIGGIGGDYLVGGAGEDRFDFNKVGESRLGSSMRDQIFDFEHLSDDLDFQSIDSKVHVAGNNAFSFINGAAFSAEGQIRATQIGTDTLVSVNTDGKTGAEMQIVLHNFTASTLTSSDFIL